MALLTQLVKLSFDWSFHDELTHWVSIRCQFVPHKVLLEACLHAKFLRNASSTLFSEDTDSAYTPSSGLGSMLRNASVVIVSGFRDPKSLSVLTFSAMVTHSLTHSLSWFWSTWDTFPSSWGRSHSAESNSSPPSYSILWIHGWQSTVTDVGLDTFGPGLSWPTSTPLARDNEVPHHANASIGGGTLHMPSPS